MKLYKQLLLVSSILVTIFIWFLFFKQEYFTEWKNIQGKYQTLLLEKAGTADTRKRADNYQIEVQQIYLPEFNQIDRCVSCHTGIDNPQMVNEVVPFKYHSGNFLNIHDPEQYGCVICHGGQGRALNKREAHAKPGSESYWDNPVLPEEYMMSNCGACHDANKIEKFAPNLSQGKELFETLGCRGCHVANGFGGTLGQSLDMQGTFPVHHYPMKNVDGEHSTWNWLQQHFLNPQLIVDDSQMKKQEMTEQEARDLTIYMMSLKGQQPYSFELTPQDRYEMIATHFGFDKFNGEDLYQQMCAVCHGSKDSPNEGKLDGQYDLYFPVLLSQEFVSTVPKEYLIQTIRKGHLGTMMSGFEGGMSPEMIDKIVNYILSFGEPRTLEPFDIKGNADDGAGLFQSVCTECHGTYGEGGKSPSLRNPIFQLYATDAFIAQTIVNGRKGTEMSPLKTLEPESSEQDVANLIAYIRKLPEIAVGSSAGAVGWQNFIDTDKYLGAVTFNEKCSSCHTIGNGDRKGPDLKGVLERRDRQWVHQQIVNPERLVKSGDKVAVELADKFGRVMENPQIPGDQVEPIIQFLENPKDGKLAVSEAMAKASEQSQGDIEKGRKLYTGEIEFKNKGPSCIACHSAPGLGILGGGNLSIDLMNSELSPAEIAASLNNVSFIVMKEVYAGKPLEPDEINDVVTFLTSAKEESKKETSKIWFVLLGIFGLVVWLFVIQTLWFKRLRNVRRDLVNRSRK